MKYDLRSHQSPQGIAELRPVFVAIVVPFSRKSGFCWRIVRDWDPMPDDAMPDDPPAPEPAAPESELPQALTPSVPGPLTSSNLASRSAGHVRTAGTALFNWWRAVTIQGLCVGVLWLIGLLLLRVPLAPVWALIAALMTLIPNFGGIISLLGPAFAILVSQPSMYRLCIAIGHVCGDCCDRSTGAAAAHHEARYPGAHLGFDPGADRARHCDSVLGNSARAPIARRGLCLSPSPLTALDQEREQAGPSPLPACYTRFSLPVLSWTSRQNHFLLE